MKLGFGQKARMDRIFEGYEKRVIIDENGNEKEKFVYTKEFFTPNMTKKNFILSKILYIGLLLISAGCQLYCGLKVVPMNLTYKHMGLAQCIGLLALVIVGIYIGSKATAPLKMEIYAYKNSHTKLINAATVSGLLITLVFLISVVTMIMAKAVSFGNIIWSLLYLLAALVIFAIMFLEKRVEFTILDPEEYI